MRSALPIAAPIFTATRVNLLFLAMFILRLERMPSYTIRKIMRFAHQKNTGLKTRHYILADKAPATARGRYISGEFQVD